MGIILEIRHKQPGWYAPENEVVKWLRENLSFEDYVMKITTATILLGFNNEEDYNLFRLTEGLNWNLRVLPEPFINTNVFWRSNNEI